MARYGRGLICLTLTEQRCRQLNLAPMVQVNGTAHGTNFTVSIEAESEDDAEQKAWDEFNMDEGYFEVGNADWTIETITEEKKNENR
jgi:hypothetical protein